MTEPGGINREHISSILWETPVVIKRLSALINDDDDDDDDGVVVVFDTICWSYWLLMNVVIYNYAVWFARLATYKCNICVNIIINKLSSQKKCTNYIENINNFYIIITQNWCCKYIVYLIILYL